VGVVIDICGSGSDTNFLYDSRHHSSVRSVVNGMRLATMVAQGGKVV
jgi:hypothetical protein